jgi:hypothetical protein
MTEVYRGYQISYCPPPIPDRRFDWSWCSENYDAWTDDGDWRDNGLAGHSASLEEAKRDIDEQIAEREAEDAQRRLDHQATENALRYGRMLGGLMDRIGGAK